MILVCHAISQDHMMTRSSHFMGRGLSRQVNFLQSLVAIATLLVVMILVYEL